ncbi:MAG: DUF996 domain-containing protein [Candidatus Caldarchaeum sp.]
MSDLGQARVLGGVASILLVLGIVPSVGPMLGIVGFVLLLVSLKQISDIVQQPAIFKNALIATIVGIVGAVAAIVFGGAAIMSLFTNGFSQFDIVRTFVSILLALVVVWVALVVSSMFLRKSLNLTANVLGIGLFRTAGLLILIGAILTIILVGAIVVLVAYVLLAAAFFQVKPDSQPSSVSPPS